MLQYCNKFVICTIVTACTFVIVLLVFNIINKWL